MSSPTNAGPIPTQSYTARLLSGGLHGLRATEKVTEEAGELSAAALAGTDDEVVDEAADLLYHALVLLGLAPDRGDGSRKGAGSPPRGAAR